MSEVEQGQSWRKVSLLIDQWLDAHGDGIFTSEDIWRYLGLGYDDRDAKLTVSQILHYRAKVAPVPTLKQSGKTFRLVDRDAPIIRWKNGNPENVVDIKWPFGLQNFVKVKKRNVIVVGGVSNEGKTAFVHNVIHLNWRQHSIVLLDSENSDDELAERFANYPNSDEWPADFVRDRTANFSDCIEPDAINIIDYLEVQDQFWLVGRYIREIRDALRNGIAIIVLQKGERAKLPVGKEFSRHLARLVVTIDKGILTIIKGKARAVKNVNPTNMKWSFRLDETGSHFLDVQRYYGKSETEDW